MHDVYIFCFSPHSSPECESLPHSGVLKVEASHIIMVYIMAAQKRAACGMNEQMNVDRSDF